MEGERLLTVMGYMAAFQPHTVSKDDVQGRGVHKKCTGVLLGVVKPWLVYIVGLEEGV